MQSRIDWVIKLRFKPSSIALQLKCINTRNEKTKFPSKATRILTSGKARIFTYVVNPEELILPQHH